MGIEALLRVVIGSTGFLCLAAGASWAIRRYSSSWANGLWRGVLLLLWLLPLAVLGAEAMHLRVGPVRVPLLPVEPLEQTHAAVPSELAAVARAAAGASGLEAASRPLAGVAGTESARRRANPPWVPILLVVWGAGALLGAGRLVRDVRRLRALVSRSLPTTDVGVSRWIASWSRRVGVRNSPVVAESPDVIVPIVAGYLKPRLLLRAGAPLDRAELNPVIVHELAHMRRADLALCMLARVTRVVWWWNPLVFLAVRELRNTAEEACDDWAVALTGQRAAYARVLARWAEAAGPAVGAACAERGRTLVTRVRRVLRSNRNPRRDTPVWVRASLVACVTLAALFASTLHLRAAPDPLVLEDFNEPRPGGWGGGLEFAEGDDGEGLGHWFAAPQGHHLVLDQVPADWTRFKFIEFWMWSAEPNGQNVMLLAYTEGDDPNGMDYFSKRMVVDWQDWKRIRVPLSAFQMARGADWTAVKSFAFSTTGWDVQALEDTDLFIDKLRLLPDLPDQEQRPPSVISDFEGDDLDRWSGLSRDTDHVMQGEAAGRWGRLTRFRPISLGLEMDWSPYQYLEFDCYSEAPTGDRFIFCTLSMDEPRDKNLDYWAYIFHVDWDGWRHFKLPFRRLCSMRDPVGWDRVTGIQLYPDGWGMQTNPSPDTVLAFDDMRLTEGERREPPPGMVEDFEDGPWAWWWMDEGSVPAKCGDHCGQFVLHEGWRSASSNSPLTADWSRYRNLKLWVYTRALEGEVLRINARGGQQGWAGSAPLDGEGWREVTLPLDPNPGQVTSLSVSIADLTGDDQGAANRDLDPAAVLCLDDMRLE